METIESRTTRSRSERRGRLVAVGAAVVATAGVATAVSVPGVLGLVMLNHNETVVRSSTPRS